MGARLEERPASIDSIPATLDLVRCVLFFLLFFESVPCSNPLLGTVGMEGRDCAASTSSGLPLLANTSTVSFLNSPCRSPEAACTQTTRLSSILDTPFSTCTWLLRCTDIRL